MAHLDKFRARTIVLAAMLAAIASPLLIAPTTAQSTPSCQGKAATVIYIGYESEVTGTEANDVIYVEGGWNTVYGGGGDDTICTAGHFNTLYGGSGDDELVGNGLHNVLYGEGGDDILIADDENGTLMGGDGQNLCNGVGC